MDDPARDILIRKAKETIESSEELVRQSEISIRELNDSLRTPMKFVRARKRGVDLISDALPFGRLSGCSGR